MIRDHNPVLAPQRREIIRSFVQKEGVVRVEDLRKSLKVSVATIRRDLETLEGMGKLRRVHGGAVAVEKNRLEEAVFDDKTNRAGREKSRIAEMAYSLIDRNDSIYLDGGSTTLRLARLLRERTDLTLVTNSLRAAAELAESGPRVLLIGGELRRISQTMVGPLTSAVLGQVRVDKAFMGTMGFCLENGLTTTDPNESYVKALVAEQAGRVILLADSGKAGKVSFARVSGWDKVDALISDDNLPGRFAKTLRKRGLKVQLA
ncbi:MAG: DeoR family transcriptional regulator [Opitutae bacterium]|nr:DeoR family transcriptional regulator [Opitutae bacterium]